MTDLDFAGEVTNYGVHGIYSYPARFIPQIPRFFIEKYKPKVVLDPFGGSGTTAVEAKLHGALPVHVDIMPVSFALARVKCHEFTTIEFHRALVALRLALKAPERKLPMEWMDKELTCHGKDGDYRYFKDNVLEEIMAVREAILAMDDCPAKDFARLCAGQCLQRVASAMIQASHWEEGHVEREDYIDVFLKYMAQQRDKFEAYYRQHPGFLNGIHPVILNSQLGTFSWVLGSDKRAAGLKDSIDLIVKSPPYGKLVRVVNYPEIHKFTHLFFFEEPSPPPSAFIQSTAGLNQYMDRWCSFLRPGGHCVVVVAPSCSDDWVTETRAMLARSGLEKCEDVERVIDPTRKYAPRQITREWVLDWMKK